MGWGGFQDVNSWDLPAIYRSGGERPLLPEEVIRGVNCGIALNKLDPTGSAQVGLEPLSLRE